MLGTWYINVLLWVVIANLCQAQQTADTAANEKTKQILKYIKELPNQGKVLSGQFAGYSPDTFNTNQIDEIAQQTGQTPAILGCDYACGWNLQTPPQYIISYSCNPSLKDHWNKGGLVTVNMHLPNPVSPNGGGYKDRMNLNFADLINSNTDTGKRWILFLDRMAQGLDDLQQAGVTVLFRPFHEMNGDWFYWCNQDSGVFKNVWRHMFNYLTNTKQIHNVLWVYSPDQSRGNVSRYYPGDSYVDIVALDVYTNDPNSMNGYNEMLNLNKPFALGEVGPSTTNGQFDYNKWITAIQTRFPRVAYFLAWNDGWSPIRNPNAYAFFNHQGVINRDEINLGGNSIPSGSTILYNFSNGVGEWRGSNIIGGPWQSKEFVFQSTNSLKMDVQLTQGGRYTLYTQQQSTIKVSGRTKLTAQARVASWGVANNGVITAKLYIKTGSSWKWYDSGSFQLKSDTATAITLNLNQIPAAELNDVREIGMEYTSSANGGQSSVYLSYITVE
ncbi:unnamed protein product [Rotaria sp. Silwood1]|nr:unnamed protein product [Rotaria sp. Silwood1]CAF3823932.1 unnamed protein product [Rotaria sp. Silwood1]CAF4938836.1 unnamed protein product [Rotaria sp. Silwood1]CAF5014018.1 unnamed protein product [Rotaria sp. Silwood1]